MSFNRAMKNFGSKFPWPLRALGRGFLSYGHVMSVLVTFLMMFVVYWFCLPFFTFLKLGDPLRVNRNSDDKSHWEDWKKTEKSVERYGRPF